MIYIEEKDGMLYKYKVDIDYTKLDEILSELYKNNFKYINTIDNAMIREEDLDFNYLDFSFVSYSKALDVSGFKTLEANYSLIYYSKLYRLVHGLLGSDSDYNKMNILRELERYNGEEDIISLIDEEIKRISESLDKIDDFNTKQKGLYFYKLKELQSQREVASKLLSPSGFIDKYIDVMRCINFEKVGEISKEEYLRDKGIFTLSKNQCLKIECGSYCKYEVTYNKDNMEEILIKLVNNSGFMNYEGIIISTNLECILRSILKGRGDISSLLKYDSEKEEINIFRRKYSERLKEIADNMGDDIDEIIDRLMSVKAEFPYSKFNTKLTVEPQAYYDEILSELRFKLIDSESVEEVKKAVEFDEGISEEVVKLSLTKK